MSWSKIVDITMLMTPENIDRLRLVLKNLKTFHRRIQSHKLSFLEEPKNVSGIKNIYLETSAGILDVVALDNDLESIEELNAFKD